MIQRSQHLRFTLKTGEPFWIMRESFRQDFDGHIAPELGVVRLVDFAHPACANLRHNFVGTELSARRNCHFFIPAAQFSTRVIGEADSSPTGLLIRKRWPSGATSN